MEREELLRYINENFPGDKRRQELAKMYYEIPYQVINDSPTLKHYTDWSKYDSAKLRLGKGNNGKPSFNIQADRSVLFLNGSVESNIPLDNEPHNVTVTGKDNKITALTLASAKRVALSGTGKYLVYLYNDTPDLFQPININVKTSDGDVLDLTIISENKSKGMNSIILGGEVAKGSTLVLRYSSLAEDSLEYMDSRINVYGTLSQIYFLSGGKMNHVESQIYLFERASSTFNVRAFTVGDNSIDSRLDVYHMGRESESKGLMKGVAADQSYVSIRGVASVSEMGGDSSTSLVGKSLLIGREARGVVSPMLEVKTGKVKEARHSASLSKVGEDHVFYLQNRGIDRRTAEGMIIEGFLREEGDTEEVRNIISRRLTQLGYTVVE